MSEERIVSIQYCGECPHLNKVDVFKHYCRKQDRLITNRSFENGSLFPAFCELGGVPGMGLLSSLTIERNALREENRKLNVQLHYYKTVSYSLHRHVTQLRLECQALKQGWVDRKDESTDYEKTIAFLDSLGISYKIDGGTKSCPGNTVMFEIGDDEVAFTFNTDNSLHEIFTDRDDW